MKRKQKLLQTGFRTVRVCVFLVLRYGLTFKYFKIVSQTAAPTAPFLLIQFHIYIFAINVLIVATGGNETKRWR